LAAGDEMTLRFLEPEEPLPDGWQRDFILHSVGWDKDADLNTVYGQSYEPLPRTAMSRYPYPAEESLTPSREFAHYLSTYQTRKQRTARFWRRLVPPPH
jgi:hypothetical protein